MKSTDCFQFSIGTFWLTIIVIEPYDLRPNMDSRFKTCCSLTSMQLVGRDVEVGFANRIVGKLRKAVGIAQCENWRKVEVLMLVFVKICKIVDSVFFRTDVVGKLVDHRIHKRVTVQGSGLRAQVDR